MTEAGMRWRNDLGVRCEQIQEARVRVHGRQAVQQQDRWAFAFSQHFEIDAADREPFESHRFPPSETSFACVAPNRGYIRSLMRMATLQPALIAADNSR